MIDQIDVPPFLKFDPGFAILTASGFMAVHTEEGLAAAALFGREGLVSARLAAILAAALVTFAGYLLSFAVLSGVRMSAKNLQAGHVWSRLFRRWPIAGTIVVVTTAIAYGLYLWVAGGDLVAAYILLKDLYVVALMGAGLTHGLILYVRYSRVVYELRQDEFGKVLAVSGSVGMLLLVLTLYLLALNLQTLQHVPDASRGVWGLHIYGRACLLITLEVVVYGWHARWMADH